MTKQTPRERIKRLRRNVHVHSYLYYHRHTPIISDVEFDARTKELLRLQKAHPYLNEDVNGYRPDLFADWNGNTGMHFPITDEVVVLADALLDIHTRYERHKDG